jgi:microcystin-dependent protein
LRIVTGAAGTGGSVAFTTAFASQSVAGTVGDTTLTIAQMPAHSHDIICDTNESSTGQPGVGGGGSDPTYSTQSEGGSDPHTHTFTGTAINLAVQYVDCILATKDAY